MQTDDYMSAPIDEEGFVVSYELSDETNIKRFWEDYGFVVIRNLITDDQINRTIDEMWNTPYLLNRPGIDRSDPSTWENTGKWPTEMDLAKGGFLSHFTDVDLTESWQNRQNPSLYKAFSILLDRQDLWVKFDRYGMVFHPHNNVNFSRCGQREILNLTMAQSKTNPNGKRKVSGCIGTSSKKLKIVALIFPSPWKEGATSTKVQGLIALSDSTATTGGFHCVPGFHKKIVAWATENPEKRGKSQNLHFLTVKALWCSSQRRIQLEIIFSRFI
jgi:hypothetical protein